MISCGWCGNSTANLDRCTSCGHEDPARPWVQRGQEPPPVERLDPVSVRKRLLQAKQEIEADGQRVTVARLAERLDVSERTVRRWREVSA